MLSAAWDGVDQAGDPVPAGEYFVQVQATYLKLHSGNGHEVIRESVESSAQHLMVAEIVPVIGCIANYGPGYSAALIGYQNPLGEVVTFGPEVRNEFVGDTMDTPPARFEPGLQSGVDWVEFSSPDLTWHLGDREASSGSARDCVAADFPSDPAAEAPPGIVDPITPGPLSARILSGIPQDVTRSTRVPFDSPMTLGGGGTLGPQGEFVLTLTKLRRSLVQASGGTDIELLRTNPQIVRARVTVDGQAAPAVIIAECDSIPSCQADTKVFVDLQPGLSFPGPSALAATAEVTIDITQESHPYPGFELSALTVHLVVDRLTGAYTGTYESGPGFFNQGPLDLESSCAVNYTRHMYDTDPGWGICWEITTLPPPRFCASWNASFVDSGLVVGTSREDVASADANVVQQLPAAYATFALISDGPGGSETLMEGVLDADGCFLAPGRFLEESMRGRLQVNLLTRFKGPNSEVWDIGSVPDGKKSTDGVYSFEDKQPVYYSVGYPIDDSSWASLAGYMVAPESTALVNDELNSMTRVSAIVSQVLRTPDNGTKADEYYIVLADDGCPDYRLATDSCVSGRVTYVGPAVAGLPPQSQWKYVVAHELGHMIQDRFMGRLALSYRFKDGADDVSDPVGTPPLCRCDHVTVANDWHCLQSVELPGAAQTEGYAQFYASRIWNNAADNDCVFGYYKEFRDRTCPAGADCTQLGTDDWSIFPPVARACKAPVKWRNRECPNVEYGTEYDWMGFLYAVNTDSVAGLSIEDIFGAYVEACGGNCKDSLVGFDELRQAVETIYGPVDPRSNLVLQAGRNYGVSTDLTP